MCNIFAFWLRNLSLKLEKGDFISYSCNPVVNFFNLYNDFILITLGHINADYPWERKCANPMQFLGGNAMTLYNHTCRLMTVNYTCEIKSE